MKTRFNLVGRMAVRLNGESKMCVHFNSFRRGGFQTHPYEGTNVNDVTG